VLFYCVKKINKLKLNVFEMGKGKGKGKMGRDKRE
jgi:hypothetical protein